MVDSDCVLCAGISHACVVSAMQGVSVAGTQTRVAPSMEAGQVRSGNAE